MARFVQLKICCFFVSNVAGSSFLKFDVIEVKFNVSMGCLHEGGSIPHKIKEKKGLFLGI